MKKGAWQKTLLAAYIKEHYSMPNREISRLLHMGDRSQVGRSQSTIRKDKKLTKQYQRMAGEIERGTRKLHTSQADPFFTSVSKPDPNRPVPCIGRVITNQPVLADSYTFELEDGSDLELPALSLDYRRISLFEALHRVTEELGLIFRLQGDKIEFFTKDGKRIVRKQIVEPER